jgi:hypothetical protein
VRADVCEIRFQQVPPQQAAAEEIRGRSMHGLLMRQEGGDEVLVMACPGAIRRCVRSRVVEAGMRVAGCKHNTPTRQARSRRGRRGAAAGCDEVVVRARSDRSDEETLLALTAIGRLFMGECAARRSLVSFSVLCTDAPKTIGVVLVDSMQGAASRPSESSPLHQGKSEALENGHGAKQRVHNN